jgi:Bacterial alpha-L-rhamnosidase 6 hairpin glycosidase domain
VGDGTAGSRGLEGEVDREFVTANGRISPDPQTAYALALAFDLLPEEMRKQAAKRLAADVRKFGHLTTGFLGTPVLCKALSDNGYLDEAYLLLNRKEYPSWLYPVTQGATTIWERWDGIKPDGSFQNPEMNSFNHYAYGAIGEWMYRVVAGIQIDRTKARIQAHGDRAAAGRRINVCKSVGRDHVWAGGGRLGKNERQVDREG